MSVFLYSRVSTSEQSVENQKLVAKTAGYTVDYFYSDEAVSGSTKADSRKQYFAMIEAMSRGDVLLVSEISRIGRNTIDVLTNIDKFEAMGVKVCVLNYGSLDLTSDIGRIVITMSVAFAQLELSDLKRRTKAGMARTKAAGTKLGPPLKIAPNTLEAIVEAKRGGMTLEKIGAKFSIPKTTLETNLSRWGNNLYGYRQEFEARAAQHAAKKLAISPQMH